MEHHNRTGTQMNTKHTTLSLDKHQDAYLDGRDGPNMVNLGTTQRPYTIYHALMEAPPHAPIDTPQADLLELREIIQDAIEQLSPQEQEIVNQNLVSRHSLQHIADTLADYGHRPLSKSGVEYARNSALKKLRDNLSQHPLIKQYLQTQTEGYHAE